MKVKVLVSLKSGVLDPEAKAISNALHSHGFECVKGVKLSKDITLELDVDSKAKALSLAEQMSQELLANVVIEEYALSVIE